MTVNTGIVKFNIRVSVNGILFEINSPGSLLKESVSTEELVMV